MAKKKRARKGANPFNINEVDVPDMGDVDFDKPPKRKGKKSKEEEF